MDPADLQAFQTRLAAYADFLAKGADEWDRLRVSGGVLDIFWWGLVPEAGSLLPSPVGARVGSFLPLSSPSPVGARLPAGKEIWEAARKAHYAPMVDIFVADSSEVSAALHHSLISPFASPVSSSPEMPPPVLPSTTAAVPTVRRYAQASVTF